MTLIAVASLAGFSARADENRVEKPLWDCALTFQAEGGGIQILVGYYKLEGTGHVRCVDIAGNKQVIPVKVTLGGSPIAPTIAVGHFRVVGLASGVGLATRPEALLGKYYTVGARAGVVLGAGAQLAVRGGSESVTLNLALNVLEGIGLEVGFNKFKLEAM